MPVSISGREVDDDGDDDNDNAAAGDDADSLRHETAVEEVVAMEEDGTEKLEEQEAVASMVIDDNVHQNVEMMSDIPIVKGDNPLVSTSKGKVIPAMDVDSNISNTESYLIGNGKREVQFESTIMHDGKCANYKLKVGGIVSDSFRRQEEVVSAGVTKVDTESEKLMCDSEDDNIESVKTENSSSLNDDNVADSQ
jgi:tetraacyldisaccharide-1-P 4'-kinase